MVGLHHPQLVELRAVRDELSKLAAERNIFDADAIGELSARLEKLAQEIREDIATGERIIAKLAAQR